MKRLFKKCKANALKMSKIFLVLVIFATEVLSPMVVMVNAKELPKMEKGDVYNPLTNTASDSASVTIGQLINEGDVSVVKTVKKTDVLGRYEVSFEVKGKNTVTRSIAKDNYSLLCIPMFSNKKIIPNEYLGEEFRIKRVKLNIFISKLEKDKNNHASAIALNPKFDGKDKVFIEIEDSFWYYYADMSNYFQVYILLFYHLKMLIYLLCILHIF